MAEESSFFISRGGAYQAVERNGRSTFHDLDGGKSFTKQELLDFIYDLPEEKCYWDHLSEPTTLVIVRGGQSCRFDLS